MNAIDPNAGTGTHDAIQVDPVHAGPLRSWREAEARVRSDEPAPFKPGNPVWMAGWRACQEQAVKVAQTAGDPATRIAAMRPEAPR